MAKKNTDTKPMSKGKVVLNTALIILQIAIVIVAIAFSVSILLSTGYESNTDFGKSSIRLMPVLTDSMNGDKEDSFKAGDLIIVKSAEKADLSQLEEGDIITYLDYVGADLQFVTHRIVDIKTTTLEDGTEVKAYTTRGDAETSGLTKTIYAGDIKGVFIGKLAGVGSAVFWLQDPTHFFLVIMLPLILLLIYNAYLVVRFVMDAKLKKQREQLAAETAAQGGAIDVEEIRRLAMEEFKKMMEQEKKSQETVVAAEEEKVEERTSDDSALQNPSTEDVKQEQDAQAVTEINQTAESVETSEEKEVESLAEQSETAEDGVSSNSSVQDAAEEAEQPADETVPQTVEETEKTDESDEKSSDDSEKPIVKKTSAAKKTSSNAKKTTAAAKTATAKKSVATAKNGAKSTGEKSTTKKSSSTTAKKTAAAKKTTATKKPATKKTEKSGK